MKRVTVWGTTLKKVADEAQMIAHYKIIKKYVPDADVTMLTYLKPDVQNFYPDLTITPIPEFHKSLPRIFKSDLFVVAGGPIFDFPPHILKVFFLTLCLKLARVPILIYGITGFPVRSWYGRLVFKWLGNAAEEIITRDASAYNTLQDLGVKTKMQEGTDLRVILEPAPPERVGDILKNEGINPDMPMIGLTVRYIHPDVPRWVKTHLDLHLESIERFNENMGKLVAELSKVAQVFIISMNPDVSEDKAVAENLKKYMIDPSKLRVIEHRYLAVESLGIIQACDVLIAGRVGSAVFSVMNGTPLLGIAHENRMIAWMNEIGMDEYLFDWQTLDVGRMAEKVNAILKGGNERIKRVFIEQAIKARGVAWQNAETYGKYLLR